VLRWVSAFVTILRLLWAQHSPLMTTCLSVHSGLNLCDVLMSCFPACSCRARARSWAKSPTVSGVLGAVAVNCGAAA
jgi:hypothetical protein